MRVVICEDDILYQKSIRNKVERWGEQSGHLDTEIICFSSSEDMIEQWEHQLKADIVFLDIHFRNEISGVEIAQQIRMTDENVPIVFITNYDTYWREGYTLYALRYLSKPITYEDIAPCLDIAYQRIEATREEFLVFHENNARIAVRLSEIIYLEAQSPYLIIHLANSKQQLRIRHRISDVMDKTSYTLFKRSHRSYIFIGSQYI